MRHKLVGALLAAAAVFSPVPSSGAPDVVSAGPWVLQGATSLPSYAADQGVATVSDAAGHARVVTRGSGSIPADLWRGGWIHVGDPDSYAGHLLDAYQGRPGTHAKLFVLTAPDGSRSEYTHRLVPSEMRNNSFAAIAPGAQWFVAGEWGVVGRLLVFAMPRFNPGASQPGHDMPLATVITLTRPMRRVQGCAFASPTSLICSTDDRSADLYGAAQPLLIIRLAHPLDGHGQVAEPSLLGAVPHRSACPGTGENEGLDIYGGRLLLAQVEPRPCRRSTLLYSYFLADALLTTRYEPPDDLNVPVDRRPAPTGDALLDRRVEGQRSETG